jgi:hypothetical protein
MALTTLAGSNDVRNSVQRFSFSHEKSCKMLKINKQQMDAKQI